MKTAIVHDYLTQRGGAERVLECLMELYPESRLYVLIHNGKIFPDLKARTSPAQLLFSPFKTNYTALIPILPMATKALRVKGAQLVISSSHAFVKNITKPRDSIHICYCHTPIRYAWEGREDYMREQHKLFKPMIKILLEWIKRWDKRNSINVDYFIANSKNVQRRIKKYYGRDSVVIHPPVDTRRFVPSKSKSANYFLIVSRLIEYKRVDLAIEVFKRLIGEQLLVIGTGRDQAKLKELARGYNSIAFKGFVSDDELVRYYQNADALLHPQLEDAGIACLEAQSCGIPVIAFGKGGALETIVEGKTGHFFYEQNEASLRNAILEFKKMTFDKVDCRNNALEYDREVFKRRIREYVELALNRCFLTI